MIIFFCEVGVLCKEIWSLIGMLFFLRSKNVEKCRQKNIRVKEKGKVFFSRLHVHANKRDKNNFSCS